MSNHSYEKRVFQLRPDDQETFLSLSAKISEHQKQLADLPHAVEVQLRTQHTCSARRCSCH